MKYVHKVGVSGQYKLEKLKKGKVVKDFGWQNNLILDSFFRELNVQATSFQLTKCQFGTGTTPPTVGDTGLETPLGNRYLLSKSPTKIIDTTSEADYITYTVERVWDSVEGDVVGNISEFGIGITSGTTLIPYIRSLLKDPLGQPTSVTVKSDETLRLTHRFNLREKKVYDPFTVTLGGDQYTVRLGKNPYTEQLGGNYQSDFWLSDSLSRRRSVSAIPIMTQAYINGSANFNADGIVSFSGTKAVNINTTKVVDTSNQDILKCRWDIEVLASTTEVNDDLLALGIFQGFGNYTSLSYAVYYLVFDPYLKKNPNNKLSFKVELQYSRL